MKAIAILAAVCLVLMSCARQDLPFFDGMVDIGTHRLQYRSEGNGTPVVVIDSGIGDTLEKLRPLQERLSRVTRVITYNRAGYGRSEAGPLPRDCGREAEELKALLEKIPVPGPYVLLGHSLGALNAQMFAAKYPGDVAALVLLDPPPLSFILGKEYRDLAALAERMTSEWQAIADASAKSDSAAERARSALFRMIASEHRQMFVASALHVAGISTFNRLPLLVIAAGKPNPAFGSGAEEYQKYWIGQSRAIANKSNAGKFVLAENASHYVYLDAPDLVVEGITALVHEARAEK
ncbi:MAG: alpha/beta hydrolase [Acidobacteria bacterium]|jgi:pimeloyl-ACP methyl ester carboxylesterase|nr:alpha/beta hydrolase [Acidobacteriota bacterium]